MQCARLGCPNELPRGRKKYCSDKCGSVAWHDQHGRKPPAASQSKYVRVVHYPRHMEVERVLSGEVVHRFSYGDDVNKAWRELCAWCDKLGFRIMT